jgi:hypothetical protein
LPTREPAETELEVGVVEPILLELTTVIPVPAPMLFACIRNTQQYQQKMLKLLKMLRHLNQLITKERNEKMYQTVQTVECLSCSKDFATFWVYLTQQSSERK